MSDAETADLLRRFEETIDAWAKRRAVIAACPANWQIVESDQLGRAVDAFYRENPQEAEAMREAAGAFDLEEVERLLVANEQRLTRDLLDPGWRERNEA